MFTIQVDSGTLLSALGVTFLLAVGLSVLFQNRHNSLNRFWALYTFLMAAWLILNVFQKSVGSWPYVVHFLSLSSITFLGIVFYYFSKSLIDESWLWKRQDALVLIPGGLLILYIAWIYFSEGKGPLIEKNGIMPEGLFSHNGIYFAAYVSYLIGGHGLGFFVLIQGLEKLHEEFFKKQARVVLYYAILGIGGILVSVNLVQILELEILGYALSIGLLLFSVLSISFSLLRFRANRIEHLMERIRLSERTLADRNSIIEGELDLARVIQQRLMTAAPPQIPGYNIHGACISMDKVGGDFYDFTNKVNALGIFTTDVSGHGIPGAFMSSIVKMSLDFFAQEADGPGELLYFMEEVLNRRTVKGFFATAVYAELKISSQQLKYANAGHCPIVLYRRPEKKLVELNAKGKPLGWSMNKAFEEKSVQLQAGDRVVFYTDGITDCVNTENEMFGEDRFFQYISDHSEVSPSVFTESLIEHLHFYSNEAVWADDLTVVILDVL